MPFNTSLIKIGKWSVAHKPASVGFHYEAKSVIRTQFRLRQQFNVAQHGAIPSRHRIFLWARKFEDIGNARDSRHGVSRSVHT
jgi:hypothetical protein